MGIKNDIRFQLTIKDKLYITYPTNNLDMITYDPSFEKIENIYIKSIIDRKDIETNRDKILKSIFNRINI